MSTKMLEVPAILKGWIERVFTHGFAYRLTTKGWQGDVAGRIPLLTQKKALLVSTTFFAAEGYKSGARDAMERLIDCGGSGILAFARSSTSTSGPSPT